MDNVARQRFACIYQHFAGYAVEFPWYSVSHFLYLHSKGPDIMPGPRFYLYLSASPKITASGIYKIAAIIEIITMFSASRECRTQRAANNIVLFPY
jgi:hypothetical protein